MELAEAVAIVVAHTREAEGEELDDTSDYEVLRDVYDDGGINHDDINGWIEDGIIEPGDIEDAYRMVIDADEDDIEAVFEAA